LSPLRGGALPSFFYILLCRKESAKHMDTMIDYLRDFFDLKSAEERLIVAERAMDRERNNMERERIMLEMKEEDARKRMKSAVAKDDQWTAEKEAAKVARTESRMVRLDKREEKLDNIVTLMSDNRCSVLETECALLSMQASSSGVLVDLEYVNHVIGQYNMTKDSRKLIQEEINTALQGGSSEELEEENGGNNLTIEEQERAKQLIKGEVKIANQKFISEIPSVGGSKVVASSILGMSEREIAERNAENTKKMEDFIAKQVS
jgi:hypothetical protein